MFAALRGSPARWAGLRPGRRLVRALATVVVGVQGLGLLAAPVLDAAIEASSARTVVHIEGLNGTKCASVHVGDCLICRTVSDRFTPAPPPVIGVYAAAGCVAPVSVVSTRTGPSARTTRSRAPPGAAHHALTA